MLQNIVPYGTAEFDAAASDVITVYSQDDAKVYTKPTGTQVFGLLSKTVGGTEYASSALSAAARVKIEAGGREVLYNYGVAPAVLARRGLRGQGTPGVLNATGPLTAAMILSGLVTSTTAAAVAGTLPTGAVLDAAIEDMEIGDSFDWSVLVTGANAFTVTAAASGHTVVGLMAVATTVSAMFRTRKTAAATYVTYAIANAAS
jgi:hypothetical protein